MNLDIEKIKAALEDFVALYDDDIGMEKFPAATQVEIKSTTLQVLRNGRTAIAAIEAYAIKLQTIRDDPWELGGCSGRMITTESGYYGDGFIADVDTLENANLIVTAVNGLADPDAIRRECAEAAIAYMTDNTQLGINLIGLRQSIMKAGKE